MPRQSIYTLPILSVRQPYAERILSGLKVAEYRSTPTSHRGPVWLYASKACDQGGEDLARGCVVGMIELGDCSWDEERESFAWAITNKRRLVTPLTVVGTPQPRFWYAKGEWSGRARWAPV